MEQHLPLDDSRDGYPARRPRGPGRDFARGIEEHGFPHPSALAPPPRVPSVAALTAGSCRADAVPVAYQGEDRVLRAYQYDAHRMRTHRKVAGLPFGPAATSTTSLNLFSYQHGMPATLQQKLQRQATSRPPGSHDMVGLSTAAREEEVPQVNHTTGSLFDTANAQPSNSRFAEWCGESQETRLPFHSTTAPPAEVEASDQSVIEESLYAAEEEQAQRVIIAQNVLEREVQRLAELQSRIRSGTGAVKNVTGPPIPSQRGPPPAVERDSYDVDPAHFSGRLVDHYSAAPQLSRTPPPQPWERPYLPGEMCTATVQTAADGSDHREWHRQCLQSSQDLCRRLDRWCSPSHGKRVEDPWAGLAAPSPSHPDASRPCDSVREIASPSRREARTTVRFTPPTRHKRPSGGAVPPPQEWPTSQNISPQTYRERSEEPSPRSPRVAPASGSAAKRTMTLRELLEWDARRRRPGR